MPISPIELLTRLVGCPTVAGTPNGELVDWAAELLADAGFAVSTPIAARPDARNLHAVLGPAGSPGIVLSAHTDVVAVDGQDWSTDPWVLHERDGRLYGRGAADMKGFIAAVLHAVCELDAASLRAPVQVVLSSDEELGCIGIRPLLPDLTGTIAPGSTTVVGEPTRMAVVRAHKGKRALRAIVTGRACHSARAPEGVNAVEYAARLIVFCSALGAELRRARRDDAFAVPHATVSTGPIAGGVALNIVPDTCTFDVELRHLPGQDADAIVARIAEHAAQLSDEMRAIAPDTGIALSELAAYPGLVPRGTPPAALGPEGAPVDFGTEAGLLQDALGGTVVVCGPGDMAQAHRPDEYLEVEQLHAAVAFLHGLLETARDHKR